MKLFRAALLVAGAWSVAAVGMTLAPGATLAYFPSASFSPSSYPQDRPDPGAVLAYDAVGAYNGGWSAFYPDGSWYGIGSHITGPDGTQATSSSATAAQMGFEPTTTLGAYTIVIVSGENINTTACLSPGATLAACMGWAGGNAYAATLAVTEPIVPAGGGDPPTDPPVAARYSFGGFLPPVKADGSGIYKRGRTLPVKFRLADIVNGYAVSDAVARLSLANVSLTVTGSQEVAVSTSAADVGNLFRYDASSGEYIFNLDTAPLAKGTWRLAAELDDGTSYGIDISIE